METYLPLEVWDIVLSYMCPRDLKIMTLLSKDFYILAGKKLWRAPSFKKEYLDLVDLKNLIHLPIERMSINNLNIGALQACKMYEFISLLKQMKSLRTVTTQGVGWNQKVIMTFLDELVDSNINAKIEVCLIDLEIWYRTYDDEIEWVVSLLENRIDRFLIECDGCLYLSLAQLKCLLPLPITHLDISALEIKRNMYDKFVDLLKQMYYLKNLTLSNMCDKRSEETLLSEKELRKLIGLPLQKIYTSALNIGNFGELASVLSKFKDLKEIVVTELRFGLLTCSDMEKLVCLPITEIFTNSLDITSDNLPKFVEIFRRMKRLQKIILVKPNGRSANTQKLSRLIKPKDLPLLGKLPIRYVVYSTALNITKKNFKELVNCLKTMQLERFYTGHLLLGGGRSGQHFYTKPNYRKQLLEMENIPFARPSNNEDHFECEGCIYCDFSESSDNEDFDDIRFRLRR